MQAPERDGRLALQKRCNGWVPELPRPRQCFRPVSCQHHNNIPGHPLWQLLVTENDLAALEAALLTGGAPLLHNLTSRAAHPIWQLGPQHPIWQWTQEDLEQMEAWQVALPHQGPAAEGRVSSGLQGCQLNNWAGPQRNDEELQGAALLPRQQQSRREEDDLEDGMEDGMEDEGMLMQALRQEPSEEDLARDGVARWQRQQREVLQLQARNQELERQLAAERHRNAVLEREVGEERHHTAELLRTEATLRCDDLPDLLGLQQQQQRQQQQLDPPPPGDQQPPLQHPATATAAELAVSKHGRTLPEVVKGQGDEPEYSDFAFTLESKRSEPGAGVAGAEAVTNAVADAIAGNAGVDADNSSTAAAVSTPTKPQWQLPLAADGGAASPGTPLQHPLAGGVRPQDSTIEREGDGPLLLSTNTVRSPAAAGGHPEQQRPHQREDVAQPAVTGCGTAGVTAATLASLQLELEGAREEARQARKAVEAAALEREGLLRNLKEAQERARDAWAEGAQTARFLIADLRHQLSDAKQQPAQHSRDQADAAAEEVRHLQARLAAAERRERDARAEMDAAVQENGRLRRQLGEAQLHNDAAAATTKPDDAATITAFPAAVPTAATTASTDSGGLSSLLGSVHAQICSLASRAATQALLNLEAIPERRRPARAAEPAAQAARASQVAVDAVAVVTRVASDEAGDEAWDEVERLRMELREARCTVAAMADQVARLQGSLEAAVTATADARSATDDSRRAALAGWAASQEALDLVRALPGEYDRLARLQEQLTAARRDVAAAQAVRSAAVAAAAAAAGVRLPSLGATDDDEEAASYTGSSTVSAGEAAASWEEVHHRPAGPTARPPSSAVRRQQIAAPSGVQPPAGHVQQNDTALAAAESAPYTHISVQAYRYGSARNATITAHFEVSA
ncbi:hypothetical protein PLESTB_001066800 [Pleodorina starrii]|uniref:Uncharacterized protein n=1 Tax=Pleodorina starrii TaxID=330485 RepID=A0A9W6BQ70_9CHLO|nr:hypothetical protein PLESTM_001284600 [Pleodorina starrii]GLC56123.1 hypothetical protein PLESTB_001066800 [Pleodorina starrii]